MTRKKSNGPADDTPVDDGVVDGGDATEVSPSETAAETVSPDEAEELARLQEEISQLTDRHLRLAAEFDNYRKRVERERTEVYGRAQAELVARLLDALDDLRRVTDQTEEVPAAVLLDGMRLVRRKLIQALESAGLETLAADDAPFDPATMEALATAPASRPEEDDVVADVFQPGYRFRGHLIRPSRVRVKKYET